MKALLSLIVMFLLTLSAAWLPTRTAQAAQAEVNVEQPEQLAIHGYDPVAYFSQGKPVEGLQGFTASYKNATWRFASVENRDLFKADPARYAPQYGGYCAYAASKGYFADVDPAAWRVHNDKLYLNYSSEVQKLWASDMEANIAKGDENWPEMLAE